MNQQTKVNNCYCCHMLEGIPCINPAKYWVGKNGVDQYTHACETHLEELKEEGDLVFPIEDSV